MPRSEPLRCQSPRTKGGIGLGLGQLGFPFDYFQQGSESILEPVFPGDELTRAVHEQGWEKKKPQPFVMCCKPIYYQGGWVIKCHFLEQNEAALCNASAKGFAPNAGRPLLLPDAATHVTGGRMHFCGLHASNCTTASVCGRLRAGAGVLCWSGWLHSSACPVGGGWRQGGFSMQCSMVCNLHQQGGCGQVAAWEE